MDDPEQRVLLLAGRLGAHDDGWPIRSFLRRLDRLGIAAQVLCVSGADGAGLDNQIVECAALGNRWQRALAIRRLDFGGKLKPSALMHVLHTTMEPIGLAIAEHWRLPYIQTIDEFVIPSGRLRLSRRWCRGLLAVSRELADDLRRNLGAPSPFLSVVPPGITVAEGAPPPARSAHVPVIGTAGPLVVASGFATFLGAARRVLDAGVDAEFVIAGQGEDEVDLRRRADRLRIADRVTFTGHPVVGLRFWNVLDIYCQTSIVPTVGRTLAMALASGVPSIASDIEGLRTLVEDEVTGLRVPPGDSAALARTILTLLNDPDRARSLGARGREVIRRDFDADAEVRNLLAVYCTILDAPRNARRRPRCRADRGLCLLPRQRAGRRGRSTGRGRHAPLVDVRPGQEVVERQQGAEDQPRHPVEEAEPDDIGVNEADQEPCRQAEIDLLQPALEPLAGADRSGDGLAEEPLVHLGLPERVAVVLLDPGRDGRVGVMVQLVLQAEHPAPELDVLVRLVVAGLDVRPDGHHSRSGPAGA